MSSVQTYDMRTKKAPPSAVDEGASYAQPRQTYEIKPYILHSTTACVRLETLSFS